MPAPITATRHGTSGASCVLRPPGCAVVGARQRQLLAEHGVPLVGGGADEELDHGVERVGRRIWCGWCATVTVANERVERQRPSVRELRVGEPGIGLHEQQRVGSQVVTQHREVTGEVGDRGEQRDDVRRQDSGPELLVGGDGGRGGAVPLGHRPSGP